jgi:streptogramin lyase
MKRSIAVPVVLLMLAGCGGGGGSSPSVHAALPAAGGPTQTGTLGLTFSTLPATSASKRTPKFVSPNAATATVAVNSVVAGNFDVSATSALCQTVSSVRTCSIPVIADGGQQSISVALFGPGTPAAMLGSGSNSVNVVVGTPFTLAVGINPVVANFATFNFTPSPSFQYMTATNITGNIVFEDPSGAVITGSGNVPNFLVPVTLTSSDPHLAFIPPSLTTPGQTFTLQYDGSAAVASTVTVTIRSGTTVIATGPVILPGLNVTRINLGPIGTINPAQITSGSDGNVWVAEQTTNDIARVTPAGLVSNFPTGFPGGDIPIGVTSGADGLIYYADSTAGSCRIGRLDPSTGFQVGGFAFTGSAPCSIYQLGNDGTAGNIWFVDVAKNEVGFIAEASWPSPGAYCGVLPTAFSFSTHNAITLGSDGAMYFTESGNGHKIGRVAGTSACALSQGTEIVPSLAGNHDLGGLALGTDGNLWFTEVSHDLYGKVTSPTTTVEFQSILNPGNFANPVWLASGSDGQIWIPQGGGAVSFKPATPLMANTQFFTDVAQTDNQSVINGPDGNIWFSGLGSVGGGGFNATQDQVAKFTPR